MLVSSVNPMVTYMVQQGPFESSIPAVRTYHMYLHLCWCYYVRGPIARSLPVSLTYREKTESRLLSFNRYYVVVQTTLAIHLIFFGSYSVYDVV